MNYRKNWLLGMDIMPERKKDKSAELNEALISSRIDDYLSEDVHSVVRGILEYDPERAGYEFASLFYDLLDQKEKRSIRAHISQLKMSFFTLLDTNTSWDDVQKGSFLLAIALRWKREHEAMQADLRTLLERLEKIEEEFKRLENKKQNK